VLGGAWKELVLVLAPDVDVRTRGRLLGALANAGTGLEVFEISLEGTLDEVRDCPAPAPASLNPFLTDRNVFCHSTQW
jgi:hypothetical protein